MTFSQLLAMISSAIRVTLKTNLRLKQLVSRVNYVYVLMTKDGKTGRRFIFRDGKYSSDKILRDYDLALVFKDASAGLKALALGGDTGLREAMNNWDLEVRGDSSCLSVFAVIMAVSTGAWQRD
jgi:hypothetical protein